MLKKVIGTVVGLALVVVGMEIYFRATQSPLPPPPQKTEQETGRLVVDRKVVVDYMPQTQDEIDRSRLASGKRVYQFDGVDFGKREMVLRNLIKDGLAFNDKDMLAFFSSPFPMIDELFIQHCICKAYDTKDLRWCQMILRSPIPTAKELYDQCLSFSLTGFMLHLLLDDVPSDEARRLIRELEFPETPALPQRLLFPLYQLTRYVLKNDVDPYNFTCDKLPEEYVDICTDFGFDGGPNKYDPTDRVTYLQRYMVFQHLKSLRDTGKPLDAKMAEKNHFWRLEPIVHPGQKICEKHLLEDYRAGRDASEQYVPAGPGPGPGDGEDGPFEETPLPKTEGVAPTPEQMSDDMRAMEPPERFAPVEDNLAPDNAPPEEDLPSGDLPANIEDTSPEDLPSEDLPPDEMNEETIPEEE